MKKRESDESIRVFCVFCRAGDLELTAHFFLYRNMKQFSINRHISRNILILVC